MNRITSFIESKRMSAEDVATRLPLVGTIATSGFTTAYPKVIPVAYARRLAEAKASGQRCAVNLYTGASTGEELDGELARSGALRKRLPFQSTPDLRNRINAGEIEFIDMHLSHVAPYIEHGILDPIDAAIIEAVDVTDDGRIYLSTSSGMSPTFISYASEVYIELNTSQPVELKGFHDIFLPELPPHGRPIHINHVDDRIGVPYVRCDPAKIKGIVVTDVREKTPEFKAADDTSRAIGEHVLDFILHEIAKGRLPKNYLPFQAGVGNVANAALSCLAQDSRFGRIRMYTEVLQDSVFDLIDADKLDCASTSALTFSAAGVERFHRDIDDLRARFIIRPQEISNNPEVIRRMGIIAMNTALEADIYGNVNSTHVLGTQMMNGIGGSGDFARNAYVTIFMAPSIAKKGAISTIVPMVSHVDHNEHSTQILVTEQGLADLRGLCPRARAEVVIRKCAHPMYRDALMEYHERALAIAPGKHTPHDLARAFEWHLRLREKGTMQG